MMEKLTRSNYEIPIETTSEIDPGCVLITVTGLRCPRCSFPMVPIEHGERRKCPACELWMEAWGNALECTDDESEFRTTPARDVARMRHANNVVRTTPFVARLLKALGLVWNV